MKTKILISLIAVLFVSVLYLLYLNLSTPKPQLSFTSQPISSSTPTVSNPSWKTYENKKYGFSFQYPKNLIVSVPQKYPDIIFIDTTATEVRDNAEGPITPISIHIFFGNIKSHINEVKKSYNFSNYFTKDLKIGGKAATQIGGIVQAETYVTGDRLIKTIFQLPADKILTLDYLSRDPSVTEEIYNQILSTFKFMNSEVISDSPEEVVKKYLDASVKGDLATAKIYCPYIESTALDGYNFIDYQILSSKADNDPNYYHVYVQFTDKRGIIFNKAPPDGQNPLEVYLFKKSDGQWEALTWYFYQ